MGLVQVSDVRNIIDTDLTDPIIQAMISAADVMVMNGPALVTTVTPALAPAELFQIELFITCHLVDLRDPIALQSKIGDSIQRNFPESVTTAWGQGLKQSVFGQMAIAFDRSGALASLGRMRGSFRAAPREDGVHFTRNLTKDGL